MTSTLASLLSLAVDGDLAYVFAAGDTSVGIWLVDVSNPDTPRKVDRTGHVGEGLCFTDMAVRPPYVYLTDICSEVLHVLDISRPAEAREVAAIPLAGASASMAILGPRLFVAAGTSGALEVLDISDPATPSPMGRWLSAGSAWGVAVEGDSLYVAEVYTGFQVLDASDPSALHARGRALTASPGSGRKTAGEPWHTPDLKIGSGAAGSADGTSAVLTPLVRPLVKPQDSIVLPIWPRPMVQRPGAMAVMQASGWRYLGELQTFDVTDPDHPRRAGHVALPRLLAYRHTLAGRMDVAFLHAPYAVEEMPLAVDWRDVGRPRVAGVAQLEPAVEDAAGLAADDRYLYVAGSAFHVIDAADPDQPALRRAPRRRSRWPGCRGGQPRVRSNAHGRRGLGADRGGRLGADVAAPGGADRDE